MKELTINGGIYIIPNLCETHIIEKEIRFCQLNNIEYSEIETKWINVCFIIRNETKNNFSMNTIKIGDNEWLYNFPEYLPLSMIEYVKENDTVSFSAYCHIIYNPDSITAEEETEALVHFELQATQTISKFARYGKFEDAVKYVIKRYYFLENYPKSEGYKIEKNVYLHDKDGNIAVDPVPGEDGKHRTRRIDFVIIKDGKVVDSIDVTSKIANKNEQMDKENRIREAGGNYIKDSEGNLIEILENFYTRMERRN